MFKVNMNSSGKVRNTSKSETTILCDNETFEDS